MSHEGEASLERAGRENVAKLLRRTLIKLDSVYAGCSERSYWQPATIGRVAKVLVGDDKRYNLRDLFGKRNVESILNTELKEEVDRVKLSSPSDNERFIDAFMGDSKERVPDTVKSSYGYRWKIVEEEG